MKYPTVKPNQGHLDLKEINLHPSPPNAIYDRGKYFYNQPLPGLLICERDNPEAKPTPESAANPSQYYLYLREIIRQPYSTTAMYS
jgi:hypothetical protein